MSQFIFILSAQLWLSCYSPINVTCFMSSSRRSDPQNDVTFRSDRRHSSWFFCFNSDASEKGRACRFNSLCTAGHSDVSYDVRHSEPFPRMEFRNSRLEDSVVTRPHSNLWKYAELWASSCCVFSCCWNIRSSCQNSPAVSIQLCTFSPSSLQKPLIFDLNLVHFTPGWGPDETAGLSAQQAGLQEAAGG